MISIRTREAVPQRREGAEEDCLEAREVPDETPGGRVSSHLSLRPRKYAAKGTCTRPTTREPHTPHEIGQPRADFLIRTRSP